MREAGIAGDGVGERHAGIQATDENRLPAAAGKPGDGHAPGSAWSSSTAGPVRASSTDRNGQAAGAAQVELVHAACADSRRCQWPMPSHSTFKARHAALGLIDAADLLVGTAFPAGRTWPLTFITTGTLPARSPGS